MRNYRREDFSCRSSARWSARISIPAWRNIFPKRRWCRIVPAPLLGEHNRKVFSEILGMSDAEIEALERDKIIGTEPRS